MNDCRVYTAQRENALDTHFQKCMWHALQNASVMHFAHITDAFSASMHSQRISGHMTCARKPTCAQDCVLGHWDGRDMGVDMVVLHTAYLYKWLHVLYYILLLFSIDKSTRRAYIHMILGHPGADWRIEDCCSAGKSQSCGG